MTLKTKSGRRSKLKIEQLPKGGQLAVREPPLQVDPGNPMAMALAMIQQGADPEALKKMLDVAERFKAAEAAAAFGNAIVRFQSECPMIGRSRKAVMDRASYKYASLDDVMEIAGPILTRCGIAVSYSAPKTEAGWFQVTVHLRVGSHEEHRPFFLPVGDLAATLKEIAARMKSINTAQAYGLWLSYQKRYAFCAALGITMTDEDNDARTGPPAPVSDEHAKELKDLGQKLSPLDAGRFFTWMTERCKMTINCFDQVREADFEIAREAINRLIAKAAAVSEKSQTEGEAK